MQKSFELLSLAVRSGLKATIIGMMMMMTIVMWHRVCNTWARAETGSWSAERNQRELSTSYLINKLYFFHQLINLVWPILLSDANWNSEISRCLESNSFTSSKLNDSNWVIVSNHLLKMFKYYCNTVTSERLLIIIIASKTVLHSVRCHNLTIVFRARFYWAMRRLITVVRVGSGTRIVSVFSPLIYYII